MESFTNLRYNLFGDVMLVKDVKFINGKVKIMFENSFLIISKENYIENPLAIDSEINENKIQYLIDYEKIVLAKEKIIKLLNRKALSEFETYLKLKEMELHKKDIIPIIDELKRCGLINDEFVAMITVESELLKRKGKECIYKTLLSKKINEETINNCLSQIDEEVYRANFEKVVAKYEKMYSTKGELLKEKLLKQKLKEIGYEDSLILNIKLDNNREDEVQLAKTFISKLIKNKHYDLNNYENVNKIKIKLNMKGFSYDIINCALEEVKKNETY